MRNINVCKIELYDINDVKNQSGYKKKLREWIYSWLYIGEIN